MRFKIFLYVFFFLSVSCTSFLSDEELQERFDKAYQNKNWVDSDLYINEIIKRHSEIIDNYLKRALINSHLRPRKNTQIIEDLNVYIANNPENDFLRVFRFQTYYLNNQSKKALGEVNYLISKYGKNAYLLTWKGNLAFSLKKFKIAEQAYRERLFYNGSNEELKNVYYYWVLSKHFDGNKESALWELAALEDRGFNADYNFMQQIEKDELTFEDYNNFVVPEGKPEDIYSALNNYCSDLDVFEGKGYYRSSFLNQFFYLEKVEDLKSLLVKKDEIYALNLSDSNINELPEELFQFKNLQYLNLSTNRFKDKEKLFDDLAKLPNLIILELNRCYLRALPDNINKLKGLQMLSLSFNDFRVINESLGELTSLKYLNLGSNGKLRDLPKSIGNLRCLQMLNVSPNGLNRLRDELANCHQLVSIVGNAGTIKSLPKEMGGLINLKYVNLVANRINELPKSIGELSSIEDLSLGSNDIRILPNSFSNLTTLKSFSVEYNRFKEFPIQVLGLNNLNNLWLHNNAFKEIPVELAKMKNIKRVLLDHQIITDENISQLEAINSNLMIEKHDTRRYVKGPKRKN